MIRMDWCEKCGRYEDHTIVNEKMVCSGCHKRKKFDPDRVAMAVNGYMKKRANAFIFPENIGMAKLQKRIDMGILVIPSSVV
jgi:hypothetical protein